MDYELRIITSFQVFSNNSNQKMENTKKQFYYKLAGGFLYAVMVLGSIISFVESYQQGHTLFSLLKPIFGLVNITLVVLLIKEKIPNAMFTGKKIAYISLIYFILAVFAYIYDGKIF